MSSSMHSEQSAVFGTADYPSRDSDDTNEASEPRKKLRKQRPRYSCRECRRLKMKCDRQVPCSNCVRRRRPESCSWNKANSPPSRRVPEAQQHNVQEVQQPQSLNRNAQHNPPIPHTSGHGLTQQPQHPILPQQNLDDPVMVVARGFEDGIDNNEMLHCHSDDNGNELDQLANAASSLEPTAIQDFAPALPNRTTEPLYSIASELSGSSNHATQAIDESKETGSYGTLMLSKGGRSKYLGPTAGSEWLKDSETQDISVTPSITRAPSPEVPQAFVGAQIPLGPSSDAPIAFPFNMSGARISTRDLLSQLPLREEAWILAESYYRYCAWHHDVVPKTSFQKTFDRVYSLAGGASLSPPVNPQEIALVFIVMAQGTMYNIELPNYDPSAEDWLHLSERALVKGDFLSNNLIAGLQTLHLMAHMHLQLDKGRRGDNAWPLWGLVMRLAQAMGMHRDGVRWKLPQEVVEERRKVFWECNAADTFQAHCFSRPCTINPEHCDTAFPSEPLGPNGEKNYSVLRFELSRLSSEILNMAMRIRTPAYSEVMDLDLRLGAFEQSLPFSLRCRAAFLAMPSRYPQLQAAVAASPEPSRRSMTISFQQMNLALNISETVINLHRPYYARALYEEIDDRLQSVYAPSFLAVVERCAMIIAIVKDIHTRFPTISTRQWNFWFHVFGSALCLGTLVVRDPSNTMATFVLDQIDNAIGLFASLIQHGGDTPRYRRNLQWLLKLRTRAESKIAAVAVAPTVGSHTDADPAQREYSEGREDAEDVELLGWRTRLIERAGQDRQTVKTTHFPVTPTGSQMTDLSNPAPKTNYLRAPADQLRIAEVMSGTAMPSPYPNSTDDFLDDFWDPILSQDVFGSSHGQSHMVYWT